MTSGEDHRKIRSHPIVNSHNALRLLVGTYIAAIRPLTGEHFGNMPNCRQTGSHPQKAYAKLRGRLLSNISESIWTYTRRQLAGTVVSLKRIAWACAERNSYLPKNSSRPTAD
jgi:hypothetical protein